MSNLFYDLLSHLGFTHPFHPVLVHMPVGMTIGAVLLWFWGLFTGQNRYRATAYHVAAVAFIFVFLAIPVGIMDWQRFYGGAWIFEIKIKLALAAVYVILMVLILAIGRRHNDSPLMAVLYVSAMLTVMGLGFFGGQLVYQGFTPEAPEQFHTGRNIFEGNCSGCHRRGENIIVPTMPLRNAPQLNDFHEFLNYIRDPRMPDKSSGPMPRFTPEKLSDQEAKQLYDFLYFSFLVPNRPSQ